MKTKKLSTDWQDAHFETINLEDAPLPKEVPEVSDGQFLIYIPALTMQEIVKKTDNKVSDGKTLMYDISWYKDEKFYTKERARSGWYVVSKGLEGKSKTWHEQEAVLDEMKGRRLNAAEELYIQFSYEKVKGERLTYGSHITPYSWEYSWTSSLSSGGRVVRLGAFGVLGLDVDYDYPGYSDDSLGCRFSRRVSVDSEPLKSCSPTTRKGSEDDLLGRIQDLEMDVDELKNWRASFIKALGNVDKI